MMNPTIAQNQRRCHLDYPTKADGAPPFPQKVSWRGGDASKQQSCASILPTVSDVKDKSAIRIAMQILRRQQMLVMSSDARRKRELLLDNSDRLQTMLREYAQNRSNLFDDETDDDSFVSENDSK